MHVFMVRHNNDYPNKIIDETYNKEIIFEEYEDPEDRFPSTIFKDKNGSPQAFFFINEYESLGVYPRLYFDGEAMLAYLDKAREHVIKHIEEVKGWNK